MKQSPAHIFARCLLGALLLCTLCSAGIYMHTYGTEKMFADFDTFYQASSNVAAHHLSAVYDVNNLKALFDSGRLKEFGNFLNPPTGLLLIYPLSFFNETHALLLWSIGQLVLLYAVIRTGYIARLFASDETRAIKTEMLLIVTLLAFCLQNILFGQVAAFCTALFLLVMAWRNTKPVLAGIMLGIFSFKPQLGLLLPVLLIAESNWKPLLWAVITTAVMIILSWGFWGNGLWQDYAEMLKIRSQFLAQGPGLLFAICTSFYPAMRNLGASAAVAFQCQVILAIAIILWIWPLLKHGRESHKIMLLTYGAYLVTPYALIYDIPLLAIPCALLLRRAEANRVTLAELVALLLLILMPLVTILLQIMHIPYSVIAIGFGLVVARIQATKELG